jgi:predicted PurR-regulated permease PerM
MTRNQQAEVKPCSFLFYLLVGTALYVFIETFSFLSPILLSLLLIVLVSMAMNPVITWMRGATGGRTTAMGLVVIVFVLLLAMTVWVLFEPIKISTNKIADRLPAYWELLQKPLIKMEKQAGLSEEKLQAEVATEVAREATAAGGPQTTRQVAEPVLPRTTNQSGFLRTGLGQMLQGVGGSFRAVAFNTAQIVIVLVTVFFGVTFTLMNPRPILGAIFSLVPERHHAQALIILQRIGKFVPGWALGTILAMLTVGLLVFLLMWPLFGFVDALVLGLIAGALEAIPYLGPILSVVPAFLFALGEGGWTPIWVLIAYCVIQAVENNVVTPLIMARSMKLHPVAVLFSMLLCVTVFGVLGALVAAPMVAIMTILHDELYRKRFLPTVTDEDIDRMAGSALYQKPSVVK